MKSLDVSLLRPLQHFRGLSGEDLRTILNRAHTARFDAGADVFNEGDKADWFYLLLDGHIRVVRTNKNGEEVIVLHIHSGGMFGIAPALGRESYPATARAATEILVISWPSHLWQEFTARYPVFAQSTYGTVGGRISEMNARIMELATSQVEQRVASALLRMVTQAGEKVQSGVRIGFPVTRQNIADMTGSTMHTVSRLLSEWDRSGIIKSARREIVVTDLPALARLADQLPSP